MRKLIKTIVGWIHSSLVLALLFPAFYVLGMEDQSANGLNLHLKCLVIAIPIVLTDLLAEKCRTLLSYLILCALVFAGTGELVWFFAGTLRGSVLFWGYIITLFGETLMVIIGRLTARLQKLKDKKAEMYADPDFQPFRDPLKIPTLLFLVYFGAVYIIALNFNSPSVCNSALFSAIIYTVITFLYQYVDETDRYLTLNKRTGNVPSKRIYGIGSATLALYFLILLVLVLPSLLTISGRHYRNLRDLEFEMEITEDMLLMTEELAEPEGEDPMSFLMEELGEVKPSPWWMDFLFYVLSTAVFAFLAIALIKQILTVFRDFRMANDENGDIVEELQDAEEEIRKRKIPARRRRSSERERIRKEYRKAIRRHRKDRPGIYESPTEIETYAGIAETEEGRELHARYELARYKQET